MLVLLPVIGIHCSGEVPQASREVFMPWRKAAQSPRDVQFGKMAGLILKGYIVLLAAVVW